ncbi:DUF433 domain-containing protein [Pleomorphovibrio marinus]|uniref:DUF433 domain-containing protein n=1 Tax=Pleomorphovibrio marinus TaxID=2164132 RepID=UPI000E0A8B50|nr:DUF433 domain-containing protein [Pleomorphovibrio marinus]
MKWKEYFVFDKKVLFSKPTIKGIRVSVEQIIKLLAKGWKEEEILENYPRLTKKSLQAVFSYLLCRTVYVLSKSGKHMN